MNMPFDLRDIFNKSLLFLGIIIIIYALIWILAKLNIIPPIVYSIFPQLVLLLIGILLVYLALSKK
ncbi:MAG: hypothetical protein K6A34_08965 [Methanobrevibacter sp.]|nr:hypothetical protein [Methanobrevibacter sp.]